MLSTHKPIFTLDEVASRWGVTVVDLGCYALEDGLVLATVVNGVDAEVGEYLEDDRGEPFRAPQGRRHLAGIQPLHGCDVWPAFKGGTATIQRLRPGHANAYIDIETPPDGIEIALADLLVTRAERDRFEAEHGINGARATPSPSGPRSAPGAPARHDWDAFWISVCHHIHDHGWPDTQGAMVRTLMDWFATHATTIPDESTVKKKVSRLWRGG